ncbi:proline--tRNA ligase [Parapusillimonas granuli]|uniref:Proline--tRNA ligase n=1 Tax=Parapusillimonas granuli TaxID=380911 RepID=A0A853G314_9BURK|nr:proline--tRNA ligase [Parapusillimonas granuli]MBB5216069.1 prolyl-tRNA synthetase [Parapusillimonas granuli]MEB2401341.1 proline--tRNA ligase [Alcaligenaceae bacterium]NYT50637.1 proline--tRNA ligase [Parapusillimonas granuli]
MHASKYHINTLKEAPAEAEVKSHQLMTRAGMIRKAAGGIYTYMPLGLKVLRKIEGIVREEMNRAGAIELLMPVVQPAELWMESGRWEQYGAELLRIKDRHQRDFVLQPTSEEVITDIARNEIHSWRQLPLNFYHIQTKFRDERRPRFGLMRGREFTMKDAYSFDRDEASAQASYDAMFQAYMRIFERLGLEFRAVAADTGSIGGSRSHEFQVIADTGEDLVVYNPASQYAANIELAEAPCLIAERAAPAQALTKTATPDAPKCELVAEQLGLPLARTVKSIVLATDDPEGKQQARIWLLLLRGDHELNEVKTGKLPGFENGYRFATEAEILETFGCVPGYLGPVDTAKPVSVIADLTVAHMSDFVCGANEEGYHYTGVNWGRDLPEPAKADLRNVVSGDPDPQGGVLAIQRGIEVGHVFFLGDKYSKALNATFLETDGKPAVLQMGCYGIGISRIAAAAIEQNHDDKGIIWPRAIAPFEAVICPMNLHKSETVRNVAEKLYQELQASGVDVMLDDRDIRPGIMFADWELIGAPLRITIGDRGLKDGIVEIQTRRQAAADKIPVEQALEFSLQQLKSL